MKIEDYSLLGDTQTAALVGRNGSIDWLCLPRFDSGACFSALLREEKHGCWQLSPVGELRATRRRYRTDSLVPEYESPDFPGYEGSSHVRVGNAAAGQFQLDVYIEVVDTLHRARSPGLADDPGGIDWSVLTKLLHFLEKHWSRPDEGIWEVRGPRQHFTYSKFTAWVAVDRLIRSAEDFGRWANLPRWKAMRAAIHREVCEKGYNTEVNAFTQSYGSKQPAADLAPRTWTRRSAGWVDV